MIISLFCQLLKRGNMTTLSNDPQFSSSLRTALSGIGSRLDQMEIDNKSLFSGSGGIALFYAYLYQLSEEDDHLQKVHAIVRRQLDPSSGTFKTASYANGTIGLAWLLAHFSKMGLLALEDERRFFSALSDKIVRHSKDLFRERNTDILHGAMGAALFFRENDRYAFSRRHLAIMVSEITRSATEEGDLVYWETGIYPDFGQSDKLSKRNLGFAHGTPGILKILLDCSCYREVDAGVCERMIRKGLAYVLSFRSRRRSVSLFPYCATDDLQEGIYNTRLAWCYGDLTIALLLFHAGRKYNDPDYLRQAKEIAWHCLGRRHQPDTGIEDPYLCHGSSGVAHLYQLLYDETGEAKFREEALYWFGETIRYCNLMEDLVHPGFLEGIAGAGLSIIAALDSSCSGWNRALFLSIG